MGSASTAFVIAGMLLLLAVATGLSLLSRRSKTQSCCIIIDPAKDRRMAGAFEPE